MSLGHSGDSPSFLCSGSATWPCERCVSLPAPLSPGKNCGLGSQSEPSDSSRSKSSRSLCRSVHGGSATTLSLSLSHTPKLWSGQNARLTGNVFVAPDWLLSVVAVVLAASVVGAFTSSWRPRHLVFLLQPPACICKPSRHLRRKRSKNHMHVKKQNKASKVKQAQKDNILLKLTCVRVILVMMASMIFSPFVG